MLAVVQHDRICSASTVPALQHKSHAKRPIHFSGELPLGGEGESTSKLGGSILMRGRTGEGV